MWCWKAFLQKLTLFQLSTEPLHFFFFFLFRPPCGLHCHSLISVLTTPSKLIGEPQLNPVSLYTRQLQWIASTILNENLQPFGFSFSPLDRGFYSQGLQPSVIKKKKLCSSCHHIGKRAEEKLHKIAQDLFEACNLLLLIFFFNSKFLDCFYLTVWWYNWVFLLVFIIYLTLWSAMEHFLSFIFYHEVLCPLVRFILYDGPTCMLAVVSETVNGCHVLLNCKPGLLTGTNEVTWTWTLKWMGQLFSPQHPIWPEWGFRAKPLQFSSSWETTEKTFLGLEKLQHLFTDTL